MKAKQIIYAITVFTIMGLALYVASTFEYYGFYEECKMESSSQGGIEACVEYKKDESKTWFI